MTRNVLIFKDTLLPPSETFILSQGESLSRFTAFYLGAHAVDGIAVPRERSWFINDGGTLGRCREVAFKGLGRLSPRLGNTIRAAAPCLLHAHFGPSGVLAQPLAAAMGIPLITTCHGYDITTHDASFHNSKDFPLRNFLRKRPILQARGAAFIAVSHYLRARMISKGFPEEKTFQHYIGVDTERFRPHPGLAEATGTLTVLNVARHTSVKGLETLLRAFARVADQRPDVSLVQVGAGPLTSSLAALAKELGIGRRVRFLGSQPSDVVLSLMQKATVYAHPSQTAEEGAVESLGLVLNEASACEIPVAATASGGIPEAVLDGETGLLSPERDDECLAHNIEILLSDAGLRRRMGTRGREYVCDTFNLAKQTAALESIYEQTIGRSG